MERLYAPWRHAYVTRAPEPGACVFCDAPSTEDGRRLIVHEGRTAFIILNLYPYTSGHLMVVPRRHLSLLAELTAEELAEIGSLTQASERVLTEAYRPEGINLGMNLGRPAGAGIADHLHVHLVPRWTGDTNFMTVIGEVRVLPEELSETAARLRPLFARVAR